MNTTALESGSKEGGYAVDIFDNLVYRYEEPNGMTRWDSPLFTVPYYDDTPPCQDIWDAMVGTEGKVKTVKPNMATVMVKFQYLRWCSERKLTYPRRNPPPSQITSTNLIRLHRKYSMQSWHGRRIIRAREEESLQ